MASRSPRRKQLLAEAGFDFTVKTISFEEVFPSEVPLEELAEHLAVEKNLAHRKFIHSGVILSADTVVIANGIALAKPTDRTEAIQMIEGLSNQVHRVVSGVCISSTTQSISFSSITQVKFCKLEPHEIAFYVDRYQPFDKAGAYGIQEWIGLIGIEWIQGSYYNVVGLPVDKVYQSLKNDFKIIPKQKKSF